MDLRSLSNSGWASALSRSLFASVACVGVTPVSVPRNRPGLTAAQLQTKKLVKTAFPLSNFIALILGNTSAEAEECLSDPFSALLLPSPRFASTNTPKSCLFALKIISRRPVFESSAASPLRWDDVSVFYMCTLCSGIAAAIDRVFLREFVFLRFNFLTCPTLNQFQIVTDCPFLSSLNSFFPSLTE